MAYDQKTLEIIATSVALQLMKDPPRTWVDTMVQVFSRAIDDAQRETKRRIVVKLWGAGEDAAADWIDGCSDV